MTSTADESDSIFDFYESSTKNRNKKLKCQNEDYSFSSPQSLLENKYNTDHDT